MSEEMMQIVLGHVLTEEQQKLWLTNAWFRAAVTHFFEFLPLTIAGIAAIAEEKDAETQRAIEEITKRGGLTF